MTFKLYGLAASTAVARVLVVLYEKNVDDFEEVSIDLLKGEHKSAEMLALHPFGQVPVFTDGELTLFESRAIARMIAHKYEGQGTPLYGSTLKDKALVEQWMEVEGQRFNNPISSLVFQVCFAHKFGQTTDDKVVANDLASLGSVLDVYEKQLSKTKYLAGDFFSLADTQHLPNLWYAIVIGKKTELVDSRPAVKACVGGHFVAPVLAEVGGDGLADPNG